MGVQEGQPSAGEIPLAASDGVAIAGPTGQQMVVKIGGADSRGAYSLIEYSHAPGAAGPPAHVHRRHDEAFYVLEGQLTLTLGMAVVTVEAGQSAMVPRGTVHRPGNTSGRPVRFLFVSSPAMDDFFAELSDLVTREQGQPSAGKLRSLGERHDSIFTDLPVAGVARIRNELPGGSQPG